MCEYCKKVSDDNKPLIYSEFPDGELYTCVEIKFKYGKYALWSGISFQKINYCPMCGRKLED